MRLSIVCAVLMQSTLSLADEGMWTYNSFPAATVEKLYGFKPSQAWLDDARLATVRLAQGCSGSFVSGQGLVMTNHHCAHHCIEQLSSAKKDYVAQGFYAKTEKDEVKCPELEINQLVEISDVTARVKEATAGKSDQAYSDALKAVMATIEKECATGDELRCDVVSLYHGGLYQLYKYRRYQDVRLVFAPEFASAFFGGDPDNFMFPRYDLDISLLRVYEQGKPAATTHHFSWSKEGAKPGELTFVSGHPGGTSRELTVAQLEYQRDVMLPRQLIKLAELRGLLHEYRHRGPEQARHSKAMLFMVENSFKALRGMHEALLDKELFLAKVKAEAELKKKVDADATKKKLYGGAWAVIEHAQAELKKIREPLVFIEEGDGFKSELFQFARTLVRAADELAKPNDKRLREFGDAALPELKQSLFSTAPIFPELEIAKLSWSLTKLREHLGPDDPFVRQVLGKESPESLAASLVKGTKLANVKLRHRLFDGGKAAIDAATDPMLKLARLVDPTARALRSKFEDEIEAAVNKNSEAIAKARFEILGTSVYPDATFTLRLSFGKVEGWEENGRKIEPLTTLGGAFERHTGKDPFALPKRWLDGKHTLDLETPFNFATTNDIVGGNSGSPVINKDAQVVGLIFDGNIQSLGGEYGFDAKVNRAVAVHSAAILETLDKLYGAKRVVDEIRPLPR
ncbi:MAG: S46 family peptidase [Deltaproteobacteria bacterium]|nr:S46 family peptidase [Deltaproteobacteria bacterium]